MGLAYWKDSHGLVKGLLDGWSVSWIATAQSGQPYSEVVSNDLNNDGNRSNDIVPAAATRTGCGHPHLDMRLSRKIPIGKAGWS